jgi:hypothetical protein
MSQFEVQMVALDQRIDTSAAPIAPWQPRWAVLAKERCTRMSQNVAFSPRRQKRNVSSWDIVATRKQPNPMTRMTRNDPHLAKCIWGSSSQPANLQAVTQIIESLSHRMRVTLEFSAASPNAQGACSLGSFPCITPLKCAEPTHRAFPALTHRRPSASFRGMVD